MSELIFFEGTTIKLIANEVYASRKQLEELYDAPKKTIEDNIKKLKEDCLIVGAEIRPNSGRPYEVYNLDEILAIGLRLRSDRAIEFQRWAISKLKEEIKNSHKEIRRAQLMESIAWNHLDSKDNYRY
jgi:hypothetical protein